MKHLVIIGTGSLAREVYALAIESIGYNIEWDIKGFIDGDVKSSLKDCEKLPLPVLGDVYNYFVESDDVFCCAVGNPYARKKLINVINGKDGKFISVIHKSSYICGTAKIGIGVIIAAFSAISDNVVIGDHVFINAMSAIGHDAIVGDYSCIMSHVNITGKCIVGKNTYWGSGARILPNGKVGDDAFIGAGSVVLKKVKANKKVFGVPAVEVPF